MTEIGERGQPKPGELQKVTAELLPEELALVTEASRRIEHLDSAKDYAERYEAESGKHSPATSTATTAPPVSPRRLAHTASLQKHLWFSDPGLEAEYLARAAEHSWASDLQWVALRALVWVLCTARLAASGSPALAAALGAACVLPAAVQLAAMAWRWEACKQHLLAAALAQAVGDVAGFAAACPLYAARSAAGAAALAAGAAPGLGRRLLHFPCNAAAYMALATLRGSAPFVVRFAAATALLAVQLFALGPMSAAAGPLPADVDACGNGGGSGGALSVTLLAAAYCLPLCAVYRREAQDRAAFARAHRWQRVDTSRVDSWDSLSFVLPALAQVLCLWSYIA